MNFLTWICDSAKDHGFDSMKHLVFLETGYDIVQVIEDFIQNLSNMV